MWTRTLWSSVFFRLEFSDVFFEGGNTFVSFLFSFLNSKAILLIVEIKSLKVKLRRVSVLSCIFTFAIWTTGGTVVSWLVRSTPGRTVRPVSSPGRGHCEVFLHGQDTLLWQFLSAPRCINGYPGELNAGVNPANGLTSHPGWRWNSPSRFRLQKPG